MARFLHTADWQIGRQYPQLAVDDSQALAEARLDVVERLAGIANQHGVDAVLVAGDVFDAQTVSDKTIRRLFNTLKAFQGPWILLPGNHDAALAESVWTRAQRLAAVPANVHLALTPDVLDFPGAGFVVLAAPLTQRHTYTDLTEWFEIAETVPACVRVGLAHGSILGILADDIDATNPIAAGRATSARLDYFALGDWHGVKQVDERTWYAGTPEPDRYKDNGAGHVLLVDIAAPGVAPQVTQLAVGAFRWQLSERHLHVASDVDELATYLQTLNTNCVLRLRLSGEIDLVSHQRIAELLSAAEGRLRSLDVERDNLRLLPTAADIAALAADGYLGEVIGDLRERQNSADGDIAGEALALLAGILLDRQTGGGP